MYKSPSAYKVAAGAAEHAFIVEKLYEISSQMGRIKKNSNDGATPEERIHFEVITILSTMLPLCADSGREPSTEETVNSLCQAVKSGLDTLRERTPVIGDGEVPNLIRFFASMHTLAMFRDVAKAIRIATEWVLNFAEKEKERDRSGQSNLPKGLVVSMKDLQAAAVAALKEGKDLVNTAAAKSKTRDFMQGFGDWVFEEEDHKQIEMTTCEHSGMGSLLVSWRYNLQGWQEVTWE